MLMLLAGGVVLPFVGWFVAVAMLWASPRWRLQDKLLGTLVWPGGYAAVLLVVGGSGVLAVSHGSSSCSGHGLTNCTATPPPTNLVAVAVLLIVLAIVLAGPILMAVRLVRQARRWPGRLPADPAPVQPFQSQPFQNGRNGRESRNGKGVTARPSQ